MQSKISALSNSSIDDPLALLLQQMANQLKKADYPWLFANFTLCINVLRCESLTVSLPWLTGDFLPFLKQCCIGLDNCVNEFDFRHRLHALVRSLSDHLQKTFVNDTNAKIEIDNLLNPFLTDKLVDSQDGIVNLPHFYGQTQWTFESFFNTYDESKRFDSLKQRHAHRTQSLANQTERNRYRYLSEPIISYWKTLAKQYPKIFKAMDKQALIALGEGLWGAIISDPQKYKDCWQPLLVLQDLLSDAMPIAVIPTKTTATTSIALVTTTAAPSTAIPSAFVSAFILHQLANQIGKNTPVTEIEECLKKAVALNLQLETVLARAENCVLFQFDKAKHRLYASRQAFVLKKQIDYESLHQVFTAQQKHTVSVMQLLEQFVQAAQNALGSGVVDIAFCVLGSTSRQDRRPYSDLEFLVLYAPHQGISREQAEFYVFQCISLIEMQIIALDETHHHQNHNAGLHVDSSHHVFAKALWGIPNIVAKRFVTELVNPSDTLHPWIASETFYALLQPVLINANDSASQSVFKIYQDLVDAFLEAPVDITDQPDLLKKTIGLNPQGLTRRQAIALACCSDVTQKSVDQLKLLKNGDTVDIKQVYYKPLAYFAMNLRLFYGINTLHPADSFQTVAQGYPWAGDLIERLCCDALAFVAQHQVNLHLAAGHQEEEISHFACISTSAQTTANMSATTTSSASSFQTLPNQILAAGLDLIANGFILPLAQELTKALQANSFVSFRDIAYPILRAYLAAREKWLVRWQKAGISANILLEHPLIRSLEATPAFDGWSPYYERQRIEHINELKLFVTPIVSCCQVEGLPTRKDEKIYLPENHVKSWFDEQGNFLGTPNYSGKNSQVRRVECDKTTFYFKVKAGNAETLMGREFAVQELHGLLGGELQIAWGWPLKLTYSRKNIQKVHYVWVSSEVLGESLDVVMNNSPNRLKKNAIEAESYSQHLLLAYLTCPEDGQPANFKLQQTTQSTSRLIGIDLGQSFVNTTRKEKALQPILSVKTMVYCLNQIELPLAENVVTPLKLIDVNAWFARWQQELKAINQLFKPFLESMLEIKRIPRADWDKYNHLVNLPETAQQCVRQRFQLLQRYLITLSQPPTGWQLLERLDPLVALSYQLVKEKTKTPDDFYRIDPKAYTKDPTTGKMYSSATFQQIQTQTLSPEKLQETFQLQPDYFDTVDFSAIKKAGNIDEDQQRFALTLLKATAKKSGNHFHHLNLSNCQVINEAELIALLEQMPKVKQLDFRNCQGITLKTIFNLFVHRYGGTVFQSNYKVLCEELEEICFTYNDHSAKLVVRLNTKGRHALIEQVKSHQIQKTNIIKVLLKRLRDSDEYTRQIAAETLGDLEIVTPEIINALLKALENDSLSDSQARCSSTGIAIKSRCSAAKVLGNLKTPTQPIINALLKALKDSHWEIRLFAAKALGNLRTPTQPIINALLEALKDSHSEVRLSAAKALGNLRAPTQPIIDALIKDLKNSKLRVSCSAAAALCNLKIIIPKAIDILLRGLLNSDHKVRLSAEKALENLEVVTPEIIDALLLGLLSSDSEVCLSVTKVLGNLKTPTQPIINTLLKALKDSHWEIRLSAAKALGNLRTPTQPIINALLEALKDSHSEVRLSAAKALGNLRAPTQPIIDALIKDLKNSKLRVSCSAAAALCNLKIIIPKAIDILLRGLLNSDHKVRLSAEKALENLEVVTPEIIDALLLGLLSSDSEVCLSVTKVLGNLKTPTQPIINALLEALKDSHWEVRLSAAKALGNLGTITPLVIDVFLVALDLKRSHQNEQKIAAKMLRNLAIVRSAIISTFLSTLEENSQLHSQWEREHAIKVLGDLENSTPQIVDALLKVLKDLNAWVRLSAIEALIKLRSITPQVIDTLLNMLDNWLSNSHIYQKAASIVGEIYSSHYELKLLRTWLIDTNLNHIHLYENTLMLPIEITQKIFFFVSSDKSSRTVPCVCKDWQRWHQAFVEDQSQKQHQKLLGEVSYQETHAEEETSQEDIDFEQFQFTPKVAPQ